MGPAVKTHVYNTPSAHVFAAGVRIPSMAGSTTGGGYVRRVRIAVRKSFTAVAFSAPGREPSFYQGLIFGPSLRSALQGCIT